MSAFVVRADGSHTHHEVSWDVTIVRTPSGFGPARPGYSPRVEDVPKDIRDGLRAWLDSAEEGK